MKLIDTPALSFSDVILIPQHSEIGSRLDTDLTTTIARGITVKHPILSTNMSTVTGREMMLEMKRLGSAGILHRFLNRSQVRDSIEDLSVFPKIISIGVKEEDKALLTFLQGSTKPDMVLVDIAHGDSKQVEGMISYVKGEDGGDVRVAAGNVATREGAERLIQAGADAIRVGIGGSSVCSTRTVTGHGMPTLQSILDISPACKKYNIPLWGDGGFRDSGDIVKALAAGASCVTLGTMLAGTDKAEGEWGYNSTRGFTAVSCPNDGCYKRFYGMSSKEAQEAHRDGVKVGTTPEGVERYIEYKGTTEEVVNGILGGIRSGLTYSGARDIKELQEKAVFHVLSPGAIRESKY